MYGHGTTCQLFKSLHARRYIELCLSLMTTVIHESTVQSIASLFGTIAAQCDLSSVHFASILLQLNQEAVRVSQQHEVNLGAIAASEWPDDGEAALLDCCCS